MKNKSSNLPFLEMQKKNSMFFPVQVHFTLLSVTNGWENWILVMALDQGHNYLSQSLATSIKTP
jgi:hypothetical protein